MGLGAVNGGFRTEIAKQLQRIQMTTDKGTFRHSHFNLQVGAAVTVCISIARFELWLGHRLS